MAFKEFSKNYLSILMEQISTSFVLPSTGVFPVIYIIDLNDSESVRLSFSASL